MGVDISTSALEPANQIQLDAAQSVFCWQLGHSLDSLQLVRRLSAQLTAVEPSRASFPIMHGHTEQKFVSWHCVDCAQVPLPRIDLTLAQVAPLQR